MNSTNKEKWLRNLSSGLILMSLAVGGNAYALTPSSNHSEWNRASQAEKRIWADKAAQISAKHGSYISPSEIFSCINEVYRPPVEPHVRGMSLAEVSSLCLVQLERM